MSGLSDRLVMGFAAAFGGAPDGVVRAPGRVNLIGEHTDYNDGFVLPCAIPFETRIAWRAIPQRQVRVVALDYGGEIDTFGLDEIAHHPNAGWRDYVRGMVTTMMVAQTRMGGVEMAICGDIPRGAGLSSSASLEVAVGHAMMAASGLQVDAKTIALQAQSAENDFVGMRCGVMDQLASAAGVSGAALLIDCRYLSTQPILLPTDASILIIHSGVVRGLVEAHYNRRRDECEAAAALMGVPALRDADLAMIAATNMPADVAARARHIVSENQRVLEAVDALSENDLARLGRLMNDSHISMRDDFAITVPKVDELAAIAQSAIAGVAGGEGGARMTGGGFGGAVVAITRAHAADAVADTIRQHYRAPKGEVPDVIIVTAAAGAGPVVCS